MSVGVRASTLGIGVDVGYRLTSRLGVRAGGNAFSFTREEEIEGINYFDMDREPYVGNETIVLFDDGNQVMVSTQGEGVRFLLISGRPIGEPVAWYGPIVMNTEEELQIAFEEYRSGNFIKHK